MGSQQNSRNSSMPSQPIAEATEVFWASDKLIYNHVQIA